MLDQQTKGYEELWKAVIRPPRCEYTISELNAKIFFIDRVCYKRQDFEVVNEKKQKLQCSLYNHISIEEGKSPCVIYLHGNSSSRLEANELLPILLPNRISVCAFDFSGSGMSDGEFISQGYYEKNDVKSVVNHLRKYYRYDQISLWGRSMGAVTALMYSCIDPKITSIVADSPFCSLETLGIELAKKYTKIPEFLVKVAMEFQRSTIKSKAGFDVSEQDPLDKCVHDIKCPGIFLSAENDELIPYTDAITLHDKYSGEKKYIKCRGTHNSDRDSRVHDVIVEFFRKHFNIEEEPYCCTPRSNRKVKNTGKTLRRKFGQYDEFSRQNDEMEKKLSPKKGSYSNNRGRLTKISDLTKLNESAQTRIGPIISDKEHYKAYQKNNVDDDLDLTINFGTPKYRSEQNLHNKDDQNNKTTIQDKYDNPNCITQIKSNKAMQNNQKFNDKLKSQLLDISQKKGTKENIKNSENGGICSKKAIIEEAQKTKQMFEYDFEVKNYESMRKSTQSIKESTSKKYYLPLKISQKLEKQSSCSLSVQRNLENSQYNGDLNSHHSSMKPIIRVSKKKGKYVKVFTPIKEHSMINTNTNTKLGMDESKIDVKTVIGSMTKSTSIEQSSKNMGDSQNTNKVLASNDSGLTEKKLRFTKFQKAEAIKSFTDRNDKDQAVKTDENAIKLKRKPGAAHIQSDSTAESLNNKNSNTPNPAIIRKKNDKLKIKPLNLDQSFIKNSDTNISKQNKGSNNNKAQLNSSCLLEKGSTSLRISNRINQISNSKRSESNGIAQDSKKNIDPNLDNPVKFKNPYKNMLSEIEKTQCLFTKLQEKIAPKPKICGNYTSKPIAMKACSYNTQMGYIKSKNLDTSLNEGVDDVEEFEDNFSVAEEYSPAKKHKFREEIEPAENYETVNNQIKKLQDISGMQSNLQKVNQKNFVKKNKQLFGKG